MNYPKHFSPAYNYQIFSQNSYSWSWYVAWLIVLFPAIAITFVDVKAELAACATQRAQQATPRTPSPLAHNGQSCRQQK